MSATGMPFRKGKEESPAELLETETMMEAAFNAMHDVFKEIIKKDCTPTGLESIFKVFLVKALLSGKTKIKTGKALEEANN